MDENLYWIPLRNINGVGDKIFKKLLSIFKSPAEVFGAEKNDLLKVSGIGINIIDEIKQFDDWDRLRKVCAKISRMGYKLIKYTDESYPENLGRIYNPPVLFYSKGDIDIKDSKSVAIVGSRQPDRYGRTVTEKLVKELVGNGFTIVSGLAKGIDTMAHKSALKYGGRTIAVLGSGLDYIYPYENRNLYHEITLNGAVISEFALGTKPESGNFPRRNRLISGLSLGVLVVQAAEGSGSLITADFALEQNREIFAVPGSIGNTLSLGTNKLIQRGAKLVSEVDDILEELDNLFESCHKYKSTSNIQLSVELNEDELKVYRNLGNKPVHIDQLINTTNMNTSKVLHILLDMEVKELVYQLPGKYYQLNK